MDRPTNRLAREKSPYLLQHAHNPVDWYPWGDEALERAKREDKPIFLSIGYSTCHWCHVMERESFEDEDIARLMNDRFICIKVDREERPDLDEIYMAAVQAMTGQGGWPLSAWLTPDLEPFYTGTYFPPDDRFGRPGFPRLLEALAQVWDEQRDQAVEQGRRLTEALSALNVTATGEAVDAEAVVADTFEWLRRTFDPRFGGWGSAPKFPRADFGALCLRVFHRGGNERALDMVRTTLDRMARGGIFDHLGGGFARYSTDERWLVPHFEKMLYDNAQLAFHYVEAHQLTGDPEYATVARETLDYVLRDMTHERGGFFSAEDADSEGVEGKFYVWSLDEITRVLAPEELDVLVPFYGVSASGNWEGSNVLERVTTIGHVAGQLGIDVEEARGRLASARRKLFEVREERVRPGLDDKILTAWNGLMIQAFARAAVVLDESRYRGAAVRAADFVLDELVVGGTLMRRWRDGEAAIEGFAEDHAFLVRGLLELAQCDLDPRWIDAARDLHDTCFATFGEGGQGALFNTREGQSDLIVRSKAGHDGSTPTANSVAAANAVVLHALTGEMRYRDQAQAIVEAFSGVLVESPVAMVGLVLALEALAHEPTTLVVSSADVETARTWIREARRGYHPDLVVAHAPVESAMTESQRALAVLEGRAAAADGSTRAFVCRGFQCDAPTSDPSGLADAVGATRSTGPDR